MPKRRLCTLDWAPEMGRARNNAANRSWRAPETEGTIENFVRDPSFIAGKFDPRISETTCAATHDYETADKTQHFRRFTAKRAK